ncbi:sugar transporter [Falsirhodobacter halotolerans]|uniref:sugar transporter n=1 Tax=Falsirhodobacter halotolerans TaxID=1146892 RepID=UPI002454F75B|nr:sugar transporter [Falsirhodobacter halotolerans]
MTQTSSTTPPSPAKPAEDAKDKTVSPDPAAPAAEGQAAEAPKVPAKPGGGQGGPGKGGPGNGGPGNGGPGGKGPNAFPRLADLKTDPEAPTPIKAAGLARIKPRHRGILMAFVLVVILPVLATASYLYLWASDQYSSTLAFTMRSEDSSSAASDFLGGLSTTLGGSNSANDSDIVYEFLRSPDMVRAVDGQVDLRTLYTRPEADILMRFDADGTLEDLTDYWRKMIRIAYDSGSGLTELQVLAFRPDDAKAIAEAIETQAMTLVNNLSMTAREDATRYASDDLDIALERLKTAREALTTFRVRNQIVDINADLQSQSAIIAALQQQLTTALVEQDILQSSTSETDPRVTQATRRVDVIRQRIATERSKFGGEAVNTTGESYASIVAEFERLTVDREFAERAYTTALANYDAAIAEANRRNRYLAAYIRPTLAEKSQFPQRGLNTALVALFTFLAWAIGSLVYYSLRDRR